MTAIYTSASANNILDLTNVIAASPSFLDRLATSDQAIAAQHVHYPWLDFDLDGPGLSDRLPFAVIEQGDDVAWETFAGGESNYMQPHGQLLLTFADVDRFPGDQKKSFIDFLNFTEGVIADIAQASAYDSHIVAMRIRQVQKPGMAHPSEPQANGGGLIQYWGCRWAVEWGMEPA